MPVNRANNTLTKRQELAGSPHCLLLLFFLLALFTASTAQPFNDSGTTKHPLGEFIGKKISRSFPNLQHTRQDSVISLVVSVQSTAGFMKKYGQLVQSGFPDYKSYTLSLPAKDLRALLLDANVTFAQPAHRIPETETPVPGFDPSLIAAGLAWQRYPDATGQNITVSIKENRFDTADIDFRKRHFLTVFSSAKTDIHATYMASMIAGAGNSSRYGKGIAWKSGITSTNFSSLMPEPQSYYQENKITIQNHSYGVGVETDYGIDAAAYDESMWKDSTLIHVFSAGNAGTETPTSGKYAGLKGWATLTGSFKMSKNSLAIAALDSFYQPELRSSRGPANDGRIKPELAAYGEDGTSGAAALVSGTIALLQQKGKDILNGKMPSVALIKALLICGSDEIGQEGPDYVTGYGILNTARSLQILAEKKFLSLTMGPGQQHTVEIMVPDNQSLLSITMAWTDSAASPAAAAMLLNDLDLQVMAPDGNIIRPWILSTFPASDSLRKPAVRGVDTLNVVESISWRTPAAGKYLIQVNARRLRTKTQSFAIAWHTIQAGQLEFTNPLQTMPADASEGTVIRWNHSFLPGTQARLVWKNLTSKEDIVLQENIALDKRYFVWKPAITGIGNHQLRFDIQGQSFVSDTFLLHGRVVPKVGYICEDSLLLYWPKMPGASAYLVYSLKDSFMQPLARALDTTIVVRKSSISAPWLAVAPVTGNSTGDYGNTFNYTLQGTGCYVSSFLADLDGDLVRLTLQLGSNFGISRISFQKSMQGQFKDLGTISPVSGLNYSMEDNSLVSGANIYRAAIYLQNGQTVFTKPETVIYTGNASFILYPNPASVAAVVNFVTRNADIFQIRISDIIGRLVKTVPVNTLQTPIDLRKMQRGVYIIQALGENGKIISTKKLVLF